MQTALREQLCVAYVHIMQLFWTFRLIWANLLFGFYLYLKSIVSFLFIAHTRSSLV